MTLFIPRSLLRLADLCGDATRYALNGLRVCDLRDGRFRVEASDGKRLAIVHGHSQAPARGTAETFASLESVAHSGTEAVVAAADWKKGLRLGAKTIDRVGLVIHSGAVTFAAGPQLHTALPLDGRWPEVKAVLPKTAPLLRFSVDPQLLAGLLTAAAALQPEKGVQLWFYGHGKPLGLLAQGADALLFDALLVPLP